MPTAILEGLALVKLFRYLLVSGELARIRVDFVTTCPSGGRTMAINEVIIDKILMLRKEGHMGAREIYIGMRRQAPELDPMRYAHAGLARDRLGSCQELGPYWSASCPTAGVLLPAERSLKSDLPTSF